MTRHRIERGDPCDPALALLMARHEADCSAQTPPESCHRLDPSELGRAGVAFFVGYSGGTPVSMGALARQGPGWGELKSMHVLTEWRGCGLARLMLRRLLDEAQAIGLARVSLETGAQPIFAPARSLYAAAGFTVCGPFGSYRADPASVFMTLELPTHLAQRGPAPAP